MDHAVIGTDD